MKLRTLTPARQLAELLPKHRAIDVAGPWGSGKTVVAVQAAQAADRPLLIVTASRLEAEQVYEDLLTFSGEDRTVLFPAWEVLPTDAMAPTDDIVAERMEALQRLSQAHANGAALHVVAPVRSLLQYVVRRERLTRQTLTLKVGEEYSLDDLLPKLIKMGYDRDLMVEHRGQMSLRGGIFDLFPISSELPVRIEFFGDEVESIRRFEPETQRSVGHVDEVTVLPRSEKAQLTEEALEQDHLTPLTDYLADDTLVVWDEPVSIREEAERLAEQLGESRFMMSWDDARESVKRHTQVNLSQVALESDPGRPRVQAPMRSTTAWQGQPDGFWEALERWNLEEYAVVLLCATTGERRRLSELLEERGYRLNDGRFDLRIEVGRMRAAFSSPTDKIAIVSEREIFGRHYTRRRRRRFEAGQAITTFSDLKSGDYIVHLHHGIGRYLGLRRFEGKAGDFIAIQYTKGDRIYVPVTHIDMVQKYTGGDGAMPKIDKIGGSTWAKKKARVKKAVRDMTEQLVKLYAAREGLDGHAFSGDTPWQNEFEDAFEYDETVDQFRAIGEVKRDMEGNKPMDRLICGDVGYGKTEVALRAAFKAVMDGRQVAVLAPTTVLVEQHYNTFRERMADFPIAIEMLSRFRTAKEQRETVERMKSGEVDIVVGTHRITSQDVAFKNLGLVIIDEEQRFGVAQKEKLKEMRTLVDVISMSATPIPRTLNMSLLGVRDMSVINTAPNDRLPVHTCIETFDEQLITEAINRELARDGQVFFVHNRVQTIYAMADLVQRLVPHARIQVGHGQMPEKELEAVMTGFIKRDFDVFVCTTIIGSGIDIPNANTILINNADRFGLSELYQLRGRVGRYKHRAFAYLLVPGDKALTEDAQKRLKALEEFSTLGAGFRLAMRDLEIRGAGNLLGGEQSGQIQTVGFDTYSQLVAEAVGELKGQPIETRNLPLCEVSIDAHIPEKYVPSAAQKMTLYKRIASVRTVDDVDEMYEELKDRFGSPPLAVRRLLDVMRVRALGADAGAKGIVAGKTAVTIEFESANFLTRQSRAALSHRFGNRLEFAWQDKPSLTFTLGPDSDDDPLDIAAEICTAIAEL